MNHENERALKNPKMPEAPMGRKHHHLGRTLGIAAAAVIGAAIGIMFAPKSGEETREEIMQKAKNIAKKFDMTREDIQKNVKEVFGEVSDDLEKAYLEIRGSILAYAEEINEKNKLTQKEYNELVDEVVKDYSKGKKWAEKTIEHLIKNIQKTWKEAKEDLES